MTPADLSSRCPLAAAASVRAELESALRGILGRGYEAWRLRGVEAARRAGGAGRSGAADRARPRGGGAIHARRWVVTATTIARALDPAMRCECCNSGCDCGCVLECPIHATPACWDDCGSTGHPGATPADVGCDDCDMRETTAPMDAPEKGRAR